MIFCQIQQLFFYGAERFLYKLRTERWLLIQLFSTAARLFTFCIGLFIKTHRFAEVKKIVSLTFLVMWFSVKLRLIQLLFKRMLKFGESKSLNISSK